MLIRRVVDIARPLPRVFAYVSHFSNLFEWDANVVEGERVDLGPIGMGSKFRLQYSLGGRVQPLLYKVTEFEQNSHIRLDVDAPSFFGHDVISVEPVSDDATRLTYEATIKLRSAWKERLLRGVMQKIGDEVVARLKDVLEGRVTAPPRSPLSLWSLPYRFTVPGWNARRMSFTATEPPAPRADGGRPRVLVTGPTSGLGRSVACSLAGKGVDLVLVARNAARLDALVAELRERGYAGDVRKVLCDMSDVAAVRAACDTLVRDGCEIDALVNNAGALFAEPLAIDGVERTTMVDLVAPWVMCRKLQPLLAARKGCIVNVSSGGMYGVRLHMGQLTTPATPFSGSGAYALAKRAMCVFSRGLNDELAETGVRVHSMHPGWADTAGVRTSLPTFRAITKWWLRTAGQGADTIVWLALCNPAQGGQFWLDREVQPMHVRATTHPFKGVDEYASLKAFLDPFVSGEAPARAD